MSNEAAKEILTKKIQESLQDEAVKIYDSGHPLADQQIRLLSLDDSTDEKDLLSGRLRTVALEDDYTALSYVWGDWYDRRPMRLNGVNTTITANLAIALTRLRREKKAQNIWIDAVCINQTDLPEKAKQVEMMSEIYRRANLQTIIWLGESENHSSEAMEFIRNVDQTFFDNYDPEKTRIPGLKALPQLLKRDWWKRVWVIQEAMLSPKPIVKCGAEEADFDRFVIVRNLHWDAENADFERFRSLRHLWKDCPFTPFMYLDWRDWVGRDLGSWILDIAPFKCLYLRDKIYALLGLLRESTKKQITVDYDLTRTDRTVFLEATKICFLEAGLLTLQQGQVEKNNSLQLPSWCPDWTSTVSFVPFVGFGFSAFPKNTSFCPPTDKWLFGGDWEHKPTLMFSKDGEILFLHGFVVDTVDFVDGVGTKEIPEVSVYTGDDMQKIAQHKEARRENTKKACLRWEQQVKNSKTKSYLEPVSGGGYEEAFCRTIVANRKFDMTNLDANAILTFNAWIGRDLPPEPSSISQSEQTKNVLDFNNSVISRCANRTFITTENGRFGLAPEKTQVGDLVCILFSGDVAYILRKPPPELEGTPGSFIGEAYIHGIMQGEYLKEAKGEKFTPFWLK